MASMRDIKQRIANIRSTEQIIKAMYTISSSKLHTLRAQLEGVRPIYRDIIRQTQALAHHPEASGNAFCQEREIRHSLYLVLSSDRGFAGAYNASVLDKAYRHMRRGRNEKILVIGAKGYEYFSRKKKTIVRHVTGIADARVYYGSESLGEWIAEQYLAGEADEVFLVYTHFKNVLSYAPQIDRLLPILPAEGVPPAKDGMRYEPDLNTVIDQTIPLYLHMSLFRAFSEAHTSEQAARMVNMDAARKNASDLIEDLSQQYNRERQAAITQELSEIIGGSNLS